MCPIEANHKPEDEASLGVKMTSLQLEAIISDVVVTNGKFLHE